MKFKEIKPGMAIDDAKEVKDRLYRIYRNMISRCYNKNAKDYKYYGGKGIHMCQSWRSSFSSFCVWALLNGYKTDLTIDRIDGDKDYSPENCRWVSMNVQGKNKSNLHMIEYAGETVCLAELCRKNNIDYDLVRHRLARGKSVEEALNPHKISTSESNRIRWKNKKIEKDSNCMENDGEFIAVHEVVSRVKAVE